MNIGERDEIIFKIILTYKRDYCEPLFGETIRSVGFITKEFEKIPLGFNINCLEYMNDDELYEFAKGIGINKASASAKADVFINGQGVSLKSLQAAPPAIVNHTTRPGFEFACINAGVLINELDDIITEYWDKRMEDIIKEDTRISDINCPFRCHKEYLRPIIQYFLFDGTGKKLSVQPANYLIEFANPFDKNTYKKFNKDEAFDKIWEKLIFSLRAKKGMPINYNPTTYKGKQADSIAKWVKYCNGDYRGALHIRVSK